MKEKIKTLDAIFPMPVLLISTFNEDGSVDVMNAAWGMMYETNMIALNLSADHQTSINIRKRGGFVVHIADSSKVVEADYFGIVSAKKEPLKFKKSNLSYEKSDLVDAPIINEFKVAMVCKYLEKESKDTTLTIGEVLETLVDKDILNDGKVDIEKLDAISYDPYTHGYYKVNTRVGNAFKDGLKLK